MQQEPILRTEHLTKRFGKRTAVDNLALEVFRGDVFGLLGPNGSGKTTTIRMILGLIQPNQGSIMLMGKQSEDKRGYLDALRRTGAIVEQPTFYPFLSGRENLRGMATFAGLANDQATHARIEEVLEQVGLAERANDSYKKYSLGMKQRLGIAAALLSQPELIILDEPTNGLDPAGVVEIRRFIGQLAQQGITVIVSSHILHEIQQVCSRVAIIKFGKLLVQGNVNELLAEREGISLSFKYPEQANKAEQALKEVQAQIPWMKSVTHTQAEPGSWASVGSPLLQVEAPIDYAMEVNALLGERGIYAAEIRRQEASLEKFFLELTGEDADFNETSEPAQPQLSTGQGRSI
ncbi:ABC transporter ATP-binding protein [Ktedonobacter racemifer]|uniref:ABC transporter related protein n=1 Tax=Ktedonobacter racemifer DSM 44963 TaxID=485913 RepID=D6TGG1_KTERA|nr:ABC transporter ATP-binding protein [Ktedonobacter racemifer]EFH90673.1 ABC transporter related protein [Ktedonobacter racemifer DSM 44963]